MTGGALARHWLWLAAVVMAAVLTVGCGGGAGMAESKAAYGGEPGAVAATSAGEAPAEYDESYADAEMEEGAYLDRAEAPPPSPAPMPGEPGPMAQNAPPPEPAPDATKPPPPPPTKTAGNKVAGPLLIYRAELTMAVFEAEKTLDQTEKLARELGGYLVRRSDREIVVRVPSAKFQQAADRISGYGDLLHRNVEVEDVTEKFYDLSVRLKNARAVRDRFEQLLKEAKTVEDSLAIEKELERVTDKIEALEGKLKLLRELIAFSTITLRLEARPTDQIQQVDLPFPWLRSLGLPSLLSM